MSDFTKWEKDGKTCFGIFTNQASLVPYLRQRPGFLSQSMEGAINFKWETSTYAGNTSVTMDKVLELHVGEGLTVGHFLLYVGSVAGYQIKLCLEQGLIVPMKDAMGRSISDMSMLRQFDMPDYPAFHQMYPKRFAHLKMLEFNEAQKIKLFLLRQTWWSRVENRMTNGKTRLPTEILMMVGEFLFVSHIVKAKFKPDD